MKPDSDSKNSPAEAKPCCSGSSLHSPNETPATEAKPGNASVPEKPEDMKDDDAGEPEKDAGESSCCGSSSEKKETKTAAPSCHEEEPEEERSCCHHHDHSHGDGGGGAVPADPEAIYTCPMHPEVRQVGPGQCPKCGMDLEPAIPTGAEDEAAYQKMSQRFWISLVLTVPVLVLAMGGMIPGVHLEHWLPMTVNHWLQAALTTPIMFWTGWFVFRRGIDSVRSVNPNMWTLIMLGTSAAFLFSLAALLYPGGLPEELLENGHAPIYFESAAVIITLVILGQLLEARARSRTGEALRALMDQSAKTARRLTDDGEEEEVPVEEIHKGDRLRVRPGEKVPVDGVILEGASALDESMITGEAEAVDKAADDAVTGGTVNKTGSFVMRAERVGSETMLSRIVALVAEAQRTRAPIQGLADKVAGYFVPAVVAVAVLAFVLWAVFGSLTFAIVNAVAVLIIACPCALGLATPISIMVSVGRGALEGILIKNAEAIDRLEKIDLLFVDKTGTLTEGKPQVTDAVVREDCGWTIDEMLRVVGALENQSEHPLGQAIVAAARGELGEGEKLPDVDGFDAITGGGVTGRIHGKTWVVGKKALLQERGGTHFEDVEGLAKDWLRQARTVVYAAVDGETVGALALADPIKQTTRDALRDLRKRGIEIRMLTGDNAATARAVAEELGITHYEAEVSPEDKHRAVQKAMAEGHKVAMAGDGVNDAPALAAATVGIAMGTGTDVAIESAGVSLVKGDLRSIEKVINLSRFAMRNIRQNLFFAFIYNALGVPIAAGVLYPIFGLLLSPMIAAAAMSLSSVSVISNALRLRNAKI